MNKQVYVENSIVVSCIQTISCPASHQRELRRPVVLIALLLRNTLIQVTSNIWWTKGILVLLKKLILCVSSLFCNSYLSCACIFSEVLVQYGFCTLWCVWVWTEYNFFLNATISKFSAKMLIKEPEQHIQKAFIGDDQQVVYMLAVIGTLHWGNLKEWERVYTMIVLRGLPFLKNTP